MKRFLDVIAEEEKKSKKAVLAFGRMNPPTSGHLKLIDRVRHVADKEGASHHVVVSHSQDSKKNPLSGEEKIKHLKRYSPGTRFSASSKEHPTILHHAAKLHAQGHDHLIVVAGSDRVKEMHDLLHKYNGKTAGHGHYHFKKIEVRSAGHRDPDAEGTEGMSGTKMRQHAKNKDFSSFRQGVPHHVSDEHTKELMHDVSRGMGLHEDVNHGAFKAIFVTGGPGSGKDIIIREAIAEKRSVEMNYTQARSVLSNLHKTNDFRVESIHNRTPLIINGPAEDLNTIIGIKEHLESLGYSTMMVFVDTTNEASQERNQKLSRMMVESVRQEKWIQAQSNKEIFNTLFNNFIYFDNSDSIESIEEDITITYQNINSFLDEEVAQYLSYEWFKNRNKLNFNEMFNKNSKRIQKSTVVKYNPEYKASGPNDITPDNRAGESQIDDIKYDAPKRTKTYTFRTYSEQQQPKIKFTAPPKESNFSKDNDKVKNKKRYSDSPTVNQRMRNTNGVGPEFDTRQQGTVYPMSGLGDVTYREQTEFVKSLLKRVKEAIDDPGAVDMGVGGTLCGSTNKEPMQSYKDQERNIGIKITKKGKKMFNNKFTNKDPVAEEIKKIIGERWDDDEDDDVAKADRELARMKVKPIKADTKTDPDKEMSKLAKRTPKEVDEEVVVEESRISALESFSDSKLRNFPGSNRNRPIPSERKWTDEEKRKRFDDWVKSVAERKKKEMKENFADGRHPEDKEDVELQEKTLTPAESKKKEEIVKSMKKDKEGFKERYGKKAKSVMYATATKQAKKVAEEAEVNEAKGPTSTYGLDTFATNEEPVTPLSRAKELARTAMSRIKNEMLGKAGATSEEIDPTIKSTDTLKGRIKGGKDDDVGPAATGRSTKVKFTPGPK
jgi:hypothetical protein